MKYRYDVDEGACPNSSCNVQIADDQGNTLFSTQTSVNTPLTDTGVTVHPGYWVTVSVDPVSSGCGGGLNYTKLTKNTVSGTVLQETYGSDVTTSDTTYQLQLADFTGTTSFVAFGQLY
jgi:hypothetical protein